MEYVELAALEYSHYAIMLLMVGLALLVMEVFIPSGGIISVVSLICIVGSVWCAWESWHGTPYWWGFLLALLFLLPTAVGGAFYVFPKTGIGRRILLEAPSLDEVTPYREEQEHLTKLVGQFGKTLTLLNPGGLVLVDGERIHCESEGMIIDPQTTVEIIGLKGNRVVVRTASPEEDPSGTAQVELDESDEPPVDFDLSQS